jgi:hypothetical protein
VWASSSSTIGRSNQGSRTSRRNGSAETPSREKCRARFPSSTSTASRVIQEGAKREMSGVRISRNRADRSPPAGTRWPSYRIMNCRRSSGRSSSRRTASGTSP